MNAQVKVLCVDDDQDTADITGRALELAGCDVRVCHDALAALEVAEEFRPDVCVTELRMPGMSGLELAAVLRGRDVRCIALTRLWSSDAWYQTHNARFAGHFVKPVKPESLVEAVTRLAPAAVERGFDRLRLGAISS